MTKQELLAELEKLGFAPELLEGKTNAQLQAMLAQADEPVEEPTTEEVPETDETTEEPTDEPAEEPKNTNSKAVMVRKVIHDNKEYKVGQTLTDSDPVRLFLRQGYAQ